MSHTTCLHTPCIGIPYICVVLRVFYGVDMGCTYPVLFSVSNKLPAVFFPISGWELERMHTDLSFLLHVQPKGTEQMLIPIHSY